MKTIEFGTKRYNAPENWRELTPEQYEQLIMCPRLKADGTFDTVDHQAAACRVWLGMSHKKWAALVLSPWQWGQLRQQFAWLFTSRPTGKPPITSFAHKGRNYHLPADGYADTTAQELCFANMMYLEFAAPIDADADQATATAEKGKALDKLVATLCRTRRDDWRKQRSRADWSGDVRVPFSEALMINEADRLVDLDLSKKLIVLDYFERMNNEFLANHGELFGADKQPRYGDGRGWLMLLKNVAKEGHFGDFEKVSTTSAPLLFAALLDDMLDAQEQAERNQNTSPIQ
jgi:hypothetical protein